jgi:anti-sigma-K factor RskA
MVQAVSAARGVDESGWNTRSRWRWARRRASNAAVSCCAGGAACFNRAMWVNVQPILLVVVR